MRGPEQLSYCANQVRAGDHDRFLCALFAPAAVRDDLFALYAFNLEVARIRDLVSEPMLGEIRLQWWRESIEAIYLGQGTRTHPVLQTLEAAIQRCALPRAVFDGLLDARVHDFDTAPFANMTALEDYANATSAGLMHLALGILGGTLPQEGVRHAGIAWGLTGLLRSIGFHAARGQIFLPSDSMQAKGVRPEMLLSMQGSDALRPVILSLCTRAELHITTARGLLGKIPRHLLAALLPMRLAGLYLKQMQSRDYDPYHIHPPIPAYQRQLCLLGGVLRGRV